MKDDEYIVVWNGHLDRNEECPSLIGPRETLPDDTWVAPKRLYTKSGMYAKKDKDLGVITKPYPPMETFTFETPSQQQGTEADQTGQDQIASQGDSPEAED